MTDLNLWYTRCPTPTPLGLAVKLGFLQSTLAAKSVGLQSLQSSTDEKVRASHFDHTQPWSFRQGGNIPPIHARANGRDTRLIGINWIDEFQAVITLPSSGVRTVAELVGKRLGLPRQPPGIIDFQRATALKGLLSTLQVAGIAREAVRFVDVATGTAQWGDTTPGYPPQLVRRLPYANEITQLIKGEIDAFFVKGAEGLSLAHQFNAVILSETGGHADPAIRINNGTPRLLTVDGTLARERPDLVQSLLEAVAEAARWAAQHPDETRRFVAQEIGVSEEAVQGAFGPELHLKFSTSIDAPGLQAIDSFKGFLLAEGFIDNEFSVEAWVYD
ncbi:ABC transporter substrate-binding protein [Pseudomonas fluorescens]|uniref:ABC transporter substrate-binding protein n=1 Tax=Pseudomonas fluorescens TaxID=294 RepID=UPI00352620FA